MTKNVLQEIKQRQVYEIYQYVSCIQSVTKLTGEAMVNIWGGLNAGDDFLRGRIGKIQKKC